MSQQNKKVPYFSAKKFVEEVLAAMKLQELPEQEKELMTFQITKALSDRLTRTIIDSFGEKELFTFRKMLDDHPEMDAIDAIVMVARNSSNIQQILEKAILDLYEELTREAKQIDDALNNNAQ